MVSTRSLHFSEEWLGQRRGTDRADRGDRTDAERDHQEFKATKGAFETAESTHFGCGLCVFFRSPGPAKAGQAAH